MAITTSDRGSIEPRRMTPRNRNADSELEVPVLTRLPYVRKTRSISGHRRRIDDASQPAPGLEESKVETAPPLKLHREIEEAGEELLSPETKPTKSNTVPKDQRLSDSAYGWISKLSVTTIGVAILVFALRGMNNNPPVPASDADWEHQPAIADGDNPFVPDTTGPSTTMIDEDSDSVAQASDGPVFIDPADLMDKTPFPTAPSESEFSGMQLEPPGGELRAVESSLAVNDIAPSAENSVPVPPRPTIESPVKNEPGPSFIVAKPPSVSSGNVTPNTTTNTSNGGSITYPSTGYPGFDSSGAGVLPPAITAPFANAQSASDIRERTQSARVQLNGTIQKFTR